MRVLQCLSSGRCLVDVFSFVTLAVTPSAFELEETGAGEGIRTLDPNLGKVVLYL